MPLHLIKLCVGVDHPEQLAAFQRRRIARTGRNAHVTRQMPKRAAELLDGGSLYWVIGGFTRVRQRILGLETFTDAQGVRRCRIELDPQLIAVEARRVRAFQGWRYLSSTEAPADLPDNSAASPREDDAAPPGAMGRILRELCLL